MPQIQYGHIPLTTLDGADEGAVQTALLAQLLLGHLQLDSTLPDTESKVLQELAFGKVHA